MTTATATCRRTNTINEYRAAEIRRDFADCMRIAEDAAACETSQLWRELWTRWADVAIRNAHLAAEQERMMQDFKTFYPQA